MTYGYEDEYGESYVREWERAHPVLDFAYSLIALILFFVLHVLCGLAYGIITIPPLMLVYYILKGIFGF